MLFELPDPSTLYQALLRRDAEYEGRAFVCVSSTGVFCRLTCPARKPKAEHCQFFASVSECVEAGYRPCKRCKPLGPAASADPVISTLLSALDGDPNRRWSEGDLRELGVDPSTARRTFKRHFGITFLAMARHRRLAQGFETIAKGARVIDAQVQAGFESASAFRAAFARLLGIAPGAFDPKAMLLADWIETPLGDMIIVASRTHVHLLEFLDRAALKGELSALKKLSRGPLGIGTTDPGAQLREELDAYFAGASARFETPLAFAGTPFYRAVWDALREIPAGATSSYGELAARIGRPTAVRAVARANGANPLALVVPCHRVIGADGSLTGYGGGLWRKQRLLEIERQYAPSARA